MFENGSEMWTRPLNAFLLSTMLAATKLACVSARLGASALRGFATRAENPLVYMDFSAGGKDMGRIVFEVQLSPQL